MVASKDSTNFLMNELWV